MKLDLSQDNSLIRFFSTNLYKIINKKYLDLSRERNCFFVHVPKCAGISVKRAFFGNSDYKYGHLTYRNIESVYGVEAVKDMFVFSFVRNPWSRLFSAYTFLFSGGFNFYDDIFCKLFLKKYNTFEKFIKEWLIKGNLYSYIHFIPQYEFLVNMEDKIDLDFIGNFESIDDDFQKVVDITGFGKKLEKHNVTKRKKRYKDVYDQEMIDIVRNLYKKDVEIFGYEFE